MEPILPERHQDNRTTGIGIGLDEARCHDRLDPIEKPEQTSHMQAQIATDNFSELSLEIMLIISLYLRKVDLLNLSLTSKTVRLNTESALFQEYTYTQTPFRETFLPRIIACSRLADYVHQINITDVLGDACQYSLLLKHSEPRPMTKAYYKYPSGCSV